MIYFTLELYTHSLFVPTHFVKMTYNVGISRINIIHLELWEDISQNTSEERVQGRKQSGNFIEDLRPWIQHAWDTDMFGNFPPTFLI